MLRTLIRGPQRGGRRSDGGEAAPGAWLRLAALGAAAVTALVVISGALHLGLPHHAARDPGRAAAHRGGRSPRRPRIGDCCGSQLRRSPCSPPRAPSVPSSRSPVGPSGPSSCTSCSPAFALAAALLSAAASFRGERVPAGAWRDYLALTKPRIMVLLLITAAAGMFVGAGGLPNLPDARGRPGWAARSPAAGRAHSITTSTATSTP